ncbi:DUF92 domain-containing protein [Rossellomorea vietnamensis]|uniref:DUF92 domain-containing protein n=1 Tax=Rossellomorea vietnamensis TaxID=218284 RepID=UPI001CCE230D|nr:DUF92 domain-containing protein [Rossellomorea vietnamensis]MCA0147612.1 DUF92 domain-containing protein [Rossellomorea vietnamensis]
MKIELFLLLLFILAIAIAGWRTKNLSRSGAWMAVLIGLVIGFAYGFRGLFVLGAFFLSSSIWSHLFKKDKIGIEDRLAKTSTRDWQQVLANGGPATLFALLFSLTGESVWTFAFVASIAGANSDTWASEIGPLSGKHPFSIRSFERVPKGTSGAVSLIGTIAAVMGAAFIALTALVLLDGMDATLFLLITLSGFLGNLLDTCLGAYVQLDYRCRMCGIQTESTVHCGQQTERTKGYWMNNELVNALSSVMSGVILLLLYW